MIQYLLPDLTVMNSLSRSWSVWWDNLYGSDCWVSWGFTHPIPLHGLPFEFCHIKRYFLLTGMLPHKTKRGQAALERLKVFDGIPPPYDKVIGVKRGTTPSVAFMALSMMWTIFPYMPCLSIDSDIKSNLRHVTAQCLGYALCFFCLTLLTLPQRKRMVVPAALKIVRLKPSRKVSLEIVSIHSNQRLTMMSSLSRNWSSYWWDNFSDPIAESSFIDILFEKKTKQYFLLIKPEC